MIMTLNLQLFIFPVVVLTCEDGALESQKTLRALRQIPTFTAKVSHFQSGMLGEVISINSFACCLIIYCYGQ